MFDPTADYCIVFLDGLGIIYDVEGPGSYDQCCDVLIAKVNAQEDALKPLDEQSIRRIGRYVFPDQSSFTVCLLDKLPTPREKTQWLEPIALPKLAASPSCRPRPSKIATNTISSDTGH